MSEVSSAEPALRSALLRYRVMAYAVGIGLVVLVVIGMPLQFAAGHPEVVQIVGPLHGFLYIIYLVVAADLIRRLGWPVSQLAPVILAGLVPFLAFFVERRLTTRVESGLASGG